MTVDPGLLFISPRFIQAFERQKDGRPTNEYVVQPQVSQLSEFVSPLRMKQVESLISTFSDPRGQRRETGVREEVPSHGVGKLTRARQ